MSVAFLNFYKYFLKIFLRPMYLERLLTFPRLNN